MRSKILFIVEGVLIMGALFVWQAWWRSGDEAAALAWPDLPRWQGAGTIDPDPGVRSEPEGGEPAAVTEPFSAETTTRGAGEVGRRWDRAALARRLGEGALEQGVAAVWRDGTQLCLACRSTADLVVLDGALRGRLRQLPASAEAGADLWALAIHVERIERATLGWALVPVRAGRPLHDQSLRGVWRGPQAPAAPARAETLSGTIEHHTFSSPFLLARQTIAVYRPPAPRGIASSVEDGGDPPASVPGDPERDSIAGRSPIFYITGGPPLDDLVSILDPLMASGALSRATIVDCGLEPETGHARSAAALSAFEGFLFEEVVRWVEGEDLAHRRPRERFLLGASHGAELALALILRDAERAGGPRFSGMIGFSISASRPLEPVAPDTSFYLMAGTLVPSRHDLTRIWAERLEKNGSRVVFRERVTGDDPAVWCEETPDAMRWLQR